MSLYSSDFKKLPPLAEIPFSPLKDQVLVEPIHTAERFDRKVGLLYLPQSDERQKDMEFCYLGRVAKTGPGDSTVQGEAPQWGKAKQYGCDRVLEMHVQPDDIILYERRPWATRRWDGREYVTLIEAQHIIAVIRYNAVWDQYQPEPLYDRLVVMRIQPEDKTASGLLFLPETAETEDYHRGRVIAVGPGRRLRSGNCRGMDVSIRETVIYPKTPLRGSLVRLDGAEYIILSEDDVLGVLVQGQAA